MWVWVLERTVTFIKQIRLYNKEQKRCVFHQFIVHKNQSTAIYDCVTYATKHNIVILDTCLHIQCVQSASKWVHATDDIALFHLNFWGWISHWASSSKFYLANFRANRTANYMFRSCNVMWRRHKLHMLNCKTVELLIHIFIYLWLSLCAVIIPAWRDFALNWLQIGKLVEMVTHRNPKHDTERISCKFRKIAYEIQNEIVYSAPKIDRKIPNIRLTF